MNECVAVSIETVLGIVPVVTRENNSKISIPHLFFPWAIQLPIFPVHKLKQSLKKPRPIEIRLPWNAIVIVLRIESFESYTILIIHILKCYQGAILCNCHCFRIPRDGWMNGWNPYPSRMESSKAFIVCGDDKKEDIYLFILLSPFLSFRMTEIMGFGEYVVGLIDGLVVSGPDL